MNPRTLTFVSGLTWGLLQGNLMLIIAAVFTGRAMGIPDYVPAWEAALIVEVVLSFIVGMILGDFYEIVKAVILSSFIAFIFSPVLVSILGVSITVAPEQGYAEAIFFGVLAPFGFFVGLLAGFGGAAFAEFRSINIQRSLTSHQRRVLIVSSVILMIAFGLFEFDILATPNFSVDAPASLAVNGNCSLLTFRSGGCPIISIPFEVRIYPVRGYVGTVTILNTDSATNRNYFLCSPVSLDVPKETYASCQLNAAVFSGESWTVHNRATDGDIIHDFYAIVTVD